jgi:hypothetical protein
VGGGFCFVETPSEKFWSFFLVLCNFRPGCAVL